MKPIRGKFKIYFNRHAKDGLVWSIRSSKKTFHVSKLRIYVNSEFKYNPKSYPKGYLLSPGVLRIGPSKSEWLEKGEAKIEWN